MLQRLSTPFASMSEMARQQERIANNLANANTIGFRRDRTFSETLSEELDPENAPVTDRITSQWADPEQGALESTGNPLDVALKGEGLFAFRDEQTGAERFGRAGRFALGRDGLLRTPEGLQVQGIEAPIRIPPGAASIEIDAQGAIWADGKPAGRLRIVESPEPERLRRVSGAMFEIEGKAPANLGKPDVLQGYVETSNVNPLKEMSDMIVHFRLFESQQKIIQSTDQLLGQVTRELGKF